MLKKYKVCKRCGLNPNESQSEEQQEWESEFIEENGICSACKNEKEGTIVDKE